MRAPMTQGRGKPWRPAERGELRGRSRRAVCREGKIGQVSRGRIGGESVTTVLITPLKKLAGEQNCEKATHSVKVIRLIYDLRRWLWVIY